MAEETPTNGGERTRLSPAARLVLDGVTALLLGELLVNSALRPQPFHTVHAPLALGIAASLVAAASVGLRRLAPLTMLAVALVACTVSWIGGFQRDPYIAVGLVMYIAATTRPRRVSVSALITVAATVVLTFGALPTVYPVQKLAAGRAEDLTSLSKSVTPLAVVCAAWALGFAVRRQRAYIAAVRAQAEDQVRAQHELAWRAVTEERLRIARELHDVVAHGMSVITVQAGVGRHVIDEQPEQARAALGVIESTGRESLREMRRLLGILREDGRDGERAPAPSIADLEDLIGRIRQAGTTVDLDIRGRPRALPGVVELSAYRIVQEALTNVVKHARTDRCRISLAYASDALGIEVTDDGVGAQPATQGVGGGLVGHGLIGMRERTALHGGEFEAGPLPLRGYRVAASLPLEDARGRDVSAHADSDPIRVVVADDQALVRGAFEVLVRSAPGMTVVGSAADGTEAVEVALRERPDVVLMDVRMPRLDGIEATRQIAAAEQQRAAVELEKTRPDYGPSRQDIRVLILTTFDLDEYVYAALRAGASGFLLKDTAPVNLLNAVAVVAAGEALLAPTVTRRLIEEFARQPQPARTPRITLDGVTEREVEVLGLVGRGLSNAEIAGHLTLAGPTVKTHVSRLLMKLRARDRAQLVIAAYESGLLDADGPGRIGTRAK